MRCFQVRERPMKISDLKKKGEGIEREKARGGTWRVGVRGSEMGKQGRKERNDEKMKLSKASDPILLISAYLLMQEHDLPYTKATNSRK